MLSAANIHYEVAKYGREVIDRARVDGKGLRPVRKTPK